MESFERSSFVIRPGVQGAAAKGQEKTIPIDLSGSGHHPKTNCDLPHPVRLTMIFAHSIPMRRSGGDDMRKTLTTLTIAGAFALTAASASAARLATRWPIAAMTSWLRRSRANRKPSPTKRCRPLIRRHRPCCRTARTKTRSRPTSANKISGRSGLIPVAHSARLRLAVRDCGPIFPGRRVSVFLLCDLRLKERPPQGAGRTAAHVIFAGTRSARHRRSHRRCARPMKSGFPH